MKDRKKLPMFAFPMETERLQGTSCEKGEQFWIVLMEFRLEMLIMGWNASKIVHVKVTRQVPGHARNYTW
jgi:hypothetical protein